MFGKKILGLVSLLLSSQFLSVAKAEGESCKITYDDGTETRKRGSPSCTANEYCTKNTYNKVSNGSNDILVFVDGEGECSIKEDEIGYFLSEDGNYIQNSYGKVASNVGEITASCDTNNIGKLVKEGDNVVLCLDYYTSEEKGVTVGIGANPTGIQYLMNYHSSSSDLFASEANVKNRFVIKPTAYSLALDKTPFSDAYGVYCDYAENKVLDRMANFCTGTILNFLYTCDDGVCTQGDSKFTGTKDYLVHIGDEYKIYQSKTENELTSFEAQKTTGLNIFKKVAEDQTYFETITSADFDTYLNGIVAVPSNDYLLYDCHDGKCVVTDGYAKYNSGTPALAFFDKSTGEWSSASGEITRCTTATSDEGKVSLSESNLQLCITANSPTTSPTAGTYYIPKGANYIASIVSGNVIASTTPANGYYLIANDNTLITSSGTVDKLIKCDGTCAEAGSVAVGYYLSGINNGLIKCSTATDASSCAIHTVTSGYYPNAVSGKALLLCDGTTSKCEAEDSVDIGYYLNGESTYSDDKYTQCTSATECVTVSSFNTECDGAEDIGKIDNTGALCLDGTGTHTATFAPSGSYLISTGINSIFTSVIAFGVLKVTSNSMIIDTNVSSPVCVKTDEAIVSAANESACTTLNGSNTYYDTCGSGLCSAPGAVCNPQTGANCVNTYYLAAATGSTEVIKTPNGESTGYVFKCGGVGACTSTSVAGYYVNSKTEAFYCTGSAGQCKLATVSGSVCTANGGLYYVDSNVFLCLDKTGEEAERIKIQLDSLNEGNYIANYESENIFGIVENGYGIVKVDANSAIFNADYDNKMKYVYVGKSDLKVLVRGEICPVDAQNGGYDVLEINCTAGKCCPLAGCS